MATVGGNRQEKRKRIMSYFINATIELMEKEGIENLTIRKVAEQAKYNSATLYHYFSNLDELELFASVKCLDEYMQETLIHKAEGKDFQEWYLGQWRCFCRHSFQRPRIYNFLFFSPEGTQNLNEVFRRYYEIYPNEKEEKTEEKTEDVQALDLGAFAEKYSLTKRETEVLEALLNSDDSAKDLAKQLFISRAALYRHISSLNEKTGTKSRIGLIQFYYQQKNEE